MAKRKQTNAKSAPAAAVPKKRAAKKTAAKAPTKTVNGSAKAAPAAKAPAKARTRPATKPRAPMPLFADQQASPGVRVVPEGSSFEADTRRSTLFNGAVETMLAQTTAEPMFDLVVTSPPYNIGKVYEEKQDFDAYIAWQTKIISDIAVRLKPSGSICWQVGNFVENGSIQPLDIALAPVFYGLDFKLRNRIIWHFGHGLHSARRFSGRYEVVLWFTKSDDYVFNLDAVRVPSKYPGKRAYKGPKAGQFSGNPAGKNPEDVWSIPNVKSNHVEKTIHPCQFPVGLVERLVLALTNPGDLVFDPFAGVASSGVAALLHDRVFWGAEPMAEYVDVGAKRMSEALEGAVAYRPHDKPLYDHTKSPLSRMPKERDQ